ncbi:MAG: GNAT family N-acetyltransferase [Crocinitomicaceae bacterium]|jgi:ElaA protein|nr:GNAT family N-acetyltransferase [Crocinitomicaceae bacterium]MDP4723599.1 GNAT family N-acetyltransferase [Crocinitomicaceae bacterium]MDP4738869.1 GNAT family N-acetyltransferase [Crocinitomicaceae bacterium]MDP4799023.1 GNAT family N-acetyltransferase [Crocinitomicaceae bacterium]MDP4805794.1 GNAT family N-acetyltransferase [Crocinitomicaceae bacterium]
MDLHFSFKTFAEFTPHELYAYLQLRSEVFVVEQNCVYQDLDDKDQQSFHVMLHQADQLVACARIVPAAIAYPEISIGRVIVAEANRKQQLGHELMRYSIDQINMRFGVQKIVLSAQAHLQNFYKKHNFAPQGEIYLEDGIPHIHMERMQ